VIEQTLGVFGASRTRIEIVRLCIRRETLSTHDVVVALGMSISSARKHLAALVNAGVLTTTQRRVPGARWDRVWHIDVDVLRDAIDDLDDYLSVSSDRDG
jgi:DNA-binding transcriptional ArsR family regulator